MQLIIVRGSSGVVTWTRALVGARSWNWICGRDQFAVVGPGLPGESEAAAVAIVQHSAALVGAVSQIVQVDL